MLGKKRIFTPLRLQTIQTFLEPTESDLQQKNVSAKLELLRYLQLREEDHYNNEKYPGYFSLFGVLNGMSFSVKTSAANKMLALLKGETILPFTTQEVRALLDSRLGKITEKLKSTGMLPSAFIDAKINLVARIHNSRLKR